jgi:DNA N-6-adenine-methyltransferase (Dam)
VRAVIAPIVPASDTYCTPRWLTARLPLVDLDPCSNPRSTIRARRAAMLERGQDGLARPWVGSVFLNWPYSDPLPWAQKLRVELEAGRCTSAIILCKLDTSTMWWDETIHPVLGVWPEQWHPFARIAFDEPPALVAARVARGRNARSSTNFCSVLIHHRGTGAPLALDEVATRWVKAP